MSHGDVITRPTCFFVKGSKPTEIKPFSWNKSSIYYVHMVISTENNKRQK